MDKIMYQLQAEGTLAFEQGPKRVYTSMNIFTTPDLAERWLPIYRAHVISPDNFFTRLDPDHTTFKVIPLIVTEEEPPTKEKT